MSLTEAENIFAGVHEAGLNDLLTAFFQARPRHLNYRTSQNVINNPPAAAAWTTVPPISFPGIPGGIEYAVQFLTPTTDIHPGSGSLLPPLVLSENQFALSTRVILHILCDRAREQQEGEVIRAALGAEAIGTLVRTGSLPGSVSIRLLQVELGDITPDPLESMLECLILKVLGAALSNFEVPIETLPLPVGENVFINISRGPESEEDQFKLYGTITAT